jgi:hypothetical protein
MTDTVYNIERHELIRQKTQGPSLSSIRGGAACQLDQSCFSLPIYLGLFWWSFLGIQCGVQSFGRTAQTCSLDGTNTDTKVLGDFDLGETFVRFE